jgi:5-oxoprolinase (ATP-hydrolysing) subunit C
VSRALFIHRAGPVTTLQDAGRQGWLRLGVTPAGPMDWQAFETALAFAGAPADGVAIEVGPGGIEVTAEGGAVRLGIAARGSDVTSDGRPVPEAGTLTLAPGTRLAIIPRRSVWAYLAADGGYAVDPVLGSRATHLRTGLGPMGGRGLKAGSLVPLGRPTSGVAPAVLPAAGEADHDRPLRFVPGPQAEMFPRETMAMFSTALWRVSPQSDRMGYRLDGPGLVHRGGHDIVSDGVALGAVQVPGDGRPIVLMADRQPTGGYPKIGTVIRADLPRLAQTPPGGHVRFRPVTVAIAVEALRTAKAEIAALRGAAQNPPVATE